MGSEQPSFIWKYQPDVKKFYDAKSTQWVVAGIIVANFACQCITKQIDADGEKYPKFWPVLEDCFNVMFLVELLINMYGSWMRMFFRSYWNWFDMLVVGIGCIDLFRFPLPDSLKKIRMLRAFRVFRLFGRIESFKKILASIHRAIFGVASAFVLNSLVMCIYAVLAVDFFKDLHKGCHDHDPPQPTAITLRGKCFGEDYYGNFLTSLYTLFQILTGESWSEAAVRPVLHYYEDSPLDTFGAAAFFMSFVVINAIVLLNVVVAVLLDGMADHHENEEEEISKDLNTEDEEGDGQKHDADSAAKKDKKENEAQYEEICALNQELEAGVCLVKADVIDMKDTLNSVQKDMREQCEAIARSLHECRPLPMKNKPLCRPLSLHDHTPRVQQA